MNWQKNTQSTDMYKMVFLYTQGDCLKVGPTYPYIISLSIFIFEMDFRLKRMF